MHYMIVVSLEMSDDPKLIHEITPTSDIFILLKVSFCLSLSPQNYRWPNPPSGDKQP